MSKKIITEKYRNKFDFKVFSELPTPGKMHDYLDGLNLTKLGEGFARAVWALSSKKVVKVVINSAGVSQNKHEIQTYEKLKSSFLPKIYEYDTVKYWWLTAELVKPMTEKEYQNYFGVKYSSHFPYFAGLYESGKSFDEIKEQFQRASKNEHAEPDWNLLFKRVLEIYDFAQTADLHVREFSWDNMGTTADHRVVLLDSGFDKNGDTGN